MRKSMLVRAALALFAVVATQSAVAGPAWAGEPTRSAAAPETYLIHHHVSRQCLDGSASQGVRLNTCDPTNRYQQWTIVGNGDIKNGFGLCLDGTISSGVRVNPCSGNAWQSWWIHTVPNGNKTFANEAYQLNQSIDASVSQGVRMNASNYGEYQQFFLTSV